MRRLAAFCANPRVIRTGNSITIALIATTVLWIGLTGLAQVAAWQHKPSSEDTP